MKRQLESDWKSRLKIGPPLIYPCLLKKHIFVQGSWFLHDYRKCIFVEKYLDMFYLF